MIIEKIKDIKVAHDLFKAAGIKKYESSKMTKLFGKTQTVGASVRKLMRLAKEDPDYSNITDEAVYSSIINTIVETEQHFDPGAFKEINGEEEIPVEFTDFVIKLDSAITNAMYAPVSTKEEPIELKPMSETDIRIKQLDMLLNSDAVDDKIEKRSLNSFADVMDVLYNEKWLYQIQEKIAKWSSKGLSDDGFEFRWSPGKLMDSNSVRDLKMEIQELPDYLKNILLDFADTAISYQGVGTVSKETSKIADKFAIEYVKYMARQTGGVSRELSKEEQLDIARRPFSFF